MVLLSFFKFDQYYIMINSIIADDDLNVDLLVSDDWIPFIFERHY